MTREQRIDFISDLCAQYNCKEKLRKIHFEQYVDRRWHPHPPDEFIEWFNLTDDWRMFRVNPKVAWNCQCYRDEWMEAKQYGVCS